MPRIGAGILTGLLLLLGGAWSGTGWGKEEKQPPAKEEKQAKAPRANENSPLSRYKEDDLVRIDFCFETFVSALGSGDAEVARAFLAEVPANLKALDLKKEEDKKTFLQAFAGLKGAQIESSTRLPGGIGEVGYVKPDGGSAKIRMQMVAGAWRIVAN